eukprot:COSAG01_NODE_8849_length_2638_cov_1.501772_1_plen_78_part_10
MSRAFPSWKRSILAEIYLCHACSYHEIEVGNARAGAGEQTLSLLPDGKTLMLVARQCSCANVVPPQVNNPFKCIGNRS